MVIYCVAYGCKNEQIKGTISFHRLPFKRPELLKLWVQAIRRKNWTPTKTSLICEEHFLPTDYINDRGLTRKRLKKDAVPSVFSFTKHLIPKEAMQATIPCTCTQAVEEPVDIDEPSTSAAEYVPTKENCETQTAAEYVPTKENCETQTAADYRIAILNRKVKVLRQMVRRREAEISSMKKTINQIAIRGYKNEKIDRILRKYFGGM